MTVEIINPSIGTMLRTAQADPEGFWAMTGRLVPWRQPWEKVFEWDPGQPDERGHYFRWYVGGETNVAWNAVDRYVQQGRGGVAALVWENERGGRQVITYAQ